jgi:sec-independent protein translocase protein TatB
MFGIGMQELAIILVVALLVFGPKRIPELARMLGRGMGEFRRASSDLRQSLSLDDFQNDLRNELRKATQVHEPAEGTEDAEPDQPSTAPPESATESAAKSATESAAKPTTESAAKPAANAAAAAAASAAAVETAPLGKVPAYPSSPAPSHPGELPLGDDNAHHEVDEESGADGEAEDDRG